MLVVLRWNNQAFGGGVAALVTDFFTRPHSSTAVDTLWLVGVGGGINAANIMIFNIVVTNH